MAVLERLGAQGLIDGSCKAVRALPLPIAPTKKQGQRLARCDCWRLNPLHPLWALRCPWGPVSAFNKGNDHVETNNWNAVRGARIWRPHRTPQRGPWPLHTTPHDCVCRWNFRRGIFCCGFRLVHRRTSSFLPVFGLELHAVSGSASRVLTATIRGQRPDLRPTTTKPPSICRGFFLGPAMRPASPERPGEGSGHGKSETRCLRTYLGGGWACLGVQNASQPLVWAVYPIGAQHAKQRESTPTAPRHQRCRCFLGLPDSGMGCFPGARPWFQLVCRLAAERGGHHPGHGFDRQGRAGQGAWRPALQPDLLAHHLLPWVGHHGSGDRQEPIGCLANHSICQPQKQFLSSWLLHILYLLFAEQSRVNGFCCFA